MRTTFLVTGILLLGIALGYLIFFIMNGSSLTQDNLFFQGNVDQQGGFRNNILSTQKTPVGDSSFTIQSFSTKDIIIEK